MAEPKTKIDCIHYKPGKKECRALKKLYCKTECRCGFYKSNKEYDKEGKRKSESYVDLEL